MKTIKFRGKRSDTVEWVYGEFHHRMEHTGSKNRPGISFDDGENGWWHEVIPETVGQATGLIHEKTGKEIYEWDLFREEIETDEGDVRNYKVVMWIPQRAAFYLVDVSHISIIQDNKGLESDPTFAWLFDDAALYDFSIDCGLPLVGNIHDNPELLK